MSTLATLTMIVILSVVWGGLALCLTTALKKEKKKQSDTSTQ